MIAPRCSTYISVAGSPGRTMCSSDGNIINWSSRERAVMKAARYAVNKISILSSRKITCTILRYTNTKTTAEAVRLETALMLNSIILAHAVTNDSTGRETCSNRHFIILLIQEVLFLCNSTSITMRNSVGISVGVSIHRT